MSQTAKTPNNPVAQLARFGREVKEEARRITWPTLAETRAMAVMVFILVSLVAAFLVVTDLLIGFGFNQILGLNM